MEGKECEAGIYYARRVFLPNIFLPLRLEGADRLEPQVPLRRSLLQNGGDHSAKGV